jgi:hypothetical protein
VIAKTTLPSRWRLLSRSEEQKMEILLRIQGIICFKDLPPLQDHRYFKFSHAVCCGLNMVHFISQAKKDSRCQILTPRNPTYWAGFSILSELHGEY